MKRSRNSIPSDDIEPASPEAAAPESGGRSEETSDYELYMREIRRTALLTPAEETELADRARKGDAAARERMIKANLRLVVRIAHDYGRLGLPLMDLISEGNIGLIKAVERFDPRKGAKFSTYAGWWIKQAMKRALANQSKTIRLPVHLVDTLGRMRRVIRRYEEVEGREPDNEEIAAEMGVSVEKVAHYRTVSVRPASLDAPVGTEPEARVLGEIVGDETMANPYENVGAKNLVEDLRAAVNTLDAREAAIVKLRFGLDGAEEQTLEEIGRRFKVTRERVRQLQTLALRRLRQQMHHRDQQRSWGDIEEEKRARRRARILQEFFEQHVSQARGRRTARVARAIAAGA